jgi:hypothetical protein
VTIAPTVSNARTIAEGINFKINADGDAEFDLSGLPLRGWQRQVLASHIGATGLVAVPTIASPGRKVTIANWMVIVVLTQRAAENPEASLERIHQVIVEFFDGKVIVMHD